MTQAQWFRVHSSLLLGAVVLSTACARKPAALDRTAGAVVPALTYEARQGQAVYQHYCQTCHGETGAGDGFNAYNLDPHPRDLSDPAFQKAKSDADLADAIRRGGSGVGLSALMPPWVRTLSERQVADLVAFLRSLRRVAGGS
jgi:mono/diheme cytochrome c family protein